MLKPPKSYKPGADGIEPETTYSFRLLRIPDLPWVWAYIAGALAEMTFESRWTPDPFAIPVEDAVSIFNELYGALNMPSPLLGTVVQYVNAEPPEGVLPMDGATRQRTDYPDLWRVLDGRLKDADTFTLPNANGRFLLAGSDPTEQGGSETVTLEVEQMPPHTHDTLPHSHGEVTALPNATTIGPGAPQPTAIPGVGTTAPSGVTILAQGGGLPHDNMPPYTVVKMGVWYI